MGSFGLNGAPVLPWTLVNNHTSTAALCEVGNGNSSNCWHHQSRQARMVDCSGRGSRTALWVTPPVEVKTEALQSLTGYRFCFFCSVWWYHVFNLHRFLNLTWIWMHELCLCAPQLRWNKRLWRKLGLLHPLDLSLLSDPTSPRPLPFSGASWLMFTPVYWTLMKGSFLRANCFYSINTTEPYWEHFNTWTPWPPWQFVLLRNSSGKVKSKVYACL